MLTKTRDQQSSLCVDWMLRRHMDEVLAIEADSFGQPWGMDDFRNCLIDRNRLGQVATVDYRVVGFMIYAIQDQTYELLTMAVSADWRFRGVGRRMLGHVARKLSAGRRNRVSAIVPESNLQAHLFLRACGFTARPPILHGVPTDHGVEEDAYRFVLPVCRALQLSTD